MSTRLNLVDAINAAFNTGKDPTFIYNGTQYTFSPDGIVAWLNAIGYLTTVSGPISVTDLTASGTVIFSDLPTSDPAVVGQLWSNSDVLTISTGP